MKENNFPYEGIFLSCCHSKFSSVCECEKSGAFCFTELPHESIRTFELSLISIEYTAGGPLYIKRDKSCEVCNKIYGTNLAFIQLKGRKLDNGALCIQRDKNIS